MTERLADITARIDGIHQLGAVVNAMRGMAAARAVHARDQLNAVDSYTEMIAAAIGRALALPASTSRSDSTRAVSRTALVLFCAEQGFVGAFSERILDAVAADVASCRVLLIGSRGRSAATDRGITADWYGAMPSHSAGIPRFADHIADAIYRRIAAGQVDRLDAIFMHRRTGQASHVERRHLFPFDPAAFPRPKDANAPILNLSAETLLSDLTDAYLHAQLCNAALHAFAAENEARMEAMASAHRQIERKLSSLQSTQRVVRQEEITAEVVELAAGSTASSINRRQRDQ